ncbi:MAG TPA: 2-hydroxyacyl-CoA dehydratase family protein [Candidatus Hydrogenedentes bacterium]|nr:2-hydroxyacyl-CoA dehydratase family protein [Candidatus Hydrogenedentota bacterium]HOV61611.1 2-hydroxyacyl-CoA dehydratase family protein [Candidatus Hydrogenedentota bacterium]
MKQVQEIIDYTREALDDPIAFARRNAEAHNRHPIGYFCSYAPQELFYAAGLHPIRIFAPEIDTHRADELVQTYACGFARASLEAALDGRFDFMDGVVFVHTCDTIQNLADLWNRRVANVPAYIVSLPNRTDGPAPRKFFRRELERIRREIEARYTPIPDGLILDTVRMYLNHQRLMQDLYALRRDRPAVLSGYDMFAIVMAAFFMDRAEHAELVDWLCQAIREEHLQENPELAARPRVLVTGSMCSRPAFIREIEDAGLLVVDDDLCAGSRSFALPSNLADDPLDLLVENYLSRRACPALHMTAVHPGEALVNQARKARVDGVVFLLTQSCDPKAFEHPVEAGALAAAGIPTLTLTVEQHRAPSDQYRTRLAAFSEMLRAKRSA